MNNFRYIIVLMLLALVGLVGFQWYWIENALAVKREQFDRKVVESMNQAVNRVEKQEVLFLASRKMKEQEQLTLASLSETKKPQKKLKRILKRKTVKPVETKQAVPVSVKKDLAHSSTKQNANGLLRSPNSKKQNFPMDSVFLGFDQSSEIPSIEEFTINIQLSDVNFDERNLLPENRLAFVKKVMREQNLLMQQLEQRAGDFSNRNRGINQIFNIIDQEFNQLIMANEALVANRSQAGIGHPPMPQNYRYAFENNPSSSTSHDSLKVSGIKKGNPSGNLKPKKVLSSNAIATKKNTEPEYEWIEVEEEPKVLEKSINKANLVKDVFADFMQGKKDIYDRVNQEMLDTLLRQELKNHGIDIPFEYGVKDSGNMMFASYALDNKPELADLAYNVRLFPNDAIPQQQFLYVYFPEKDNFIMGNMWSVFGSSLILILMIGGIFFTSINTMLKQKNLSMIKNDFINNMTHEFKTPISTISLAVEVMKDTSMKSNPEKYLNIIKDENSRLGSQVEKVLQMALMDKGEVKLLTTEVDLHDLIEQVCQNLSVQIESKNGSIVLDLEAADAVIIADEVHMTNIIYNLIDNANKYSPENPRIMVATRDVDGGLALIVSDEGIGMKKEQLGKIFEKFYRVSTGNIHNVKGFGLGLSYVKKMMDLHQGDIKVMSEVNKGSTFELTFYKDLTA